MRVCPSHRRSMLRQRGADGGDDTSKEFLKEPGRGKILAGELFDLAGELHDTFAYFPQIFVCGNRFAHGDFR